MSDFIAVDCGKYNVKTASFSTETKEKKKFIFRTKVSEDTFDNDMFDKGTILAQVDGGAVLRMGMGGKQEPEMETTKKSGIHKECTLAAAALALAMQHPGTKSFEGVNIVIGIPLQLALNTKERLSYKEFILGAPGEKHTVALKPSPSSPTTEITFTFGKRLVYPEGIGVLYEHPGKLMGQTAIFDLGNLNVNAIYADQFQVMEEMCFTNELGGKTMISGLAQEISSEFGVRCNENTIGSALRAKLRYLNHRDPKIKERSGKVMESYLLNHVKEIRRAADAKQWPLDFMNIVCIGGTSKLVSRELYEVFGSDTFIPENPEYVNAEGFLKKMCADAGIDLQKETAVDKAKDQPVKKTA